MMKQHFRTMKQDMRFEFEEIKQATAMVLNAQVKVLTALTSPAEHERLHRLQEDADHQPNSHPPPTPPVFPPKDDTPSTKKKSPPMNYSTSPGHLPSVRQAATIAALSSRRARPSLQPTPRMQLSSRRIPAHILNKQQRSSFKPQGGPPPSLEFIAAAARDLGMNLGPNMTASSSASSQVPSRARARGLVRGHSDLQPGRHQRNTQRMRGSSIDRPGSGI